MDCFIDSLGEMCPVPSLKARRAYSEMSKGETLTIATDHSCVVSSIMDYFKHFNCKLVVDEVINGVWEISITKISK